MRTSTRAGRLRGRRPLAFLAGLALLVAACGASTILSSVGSPVGKDAGPVPAAPSAADAALEGGTGSRDTSGGGSTQAPPNDVSRPDLLVIKTGTMDLQVGAIDDALSAASAKVAALGGYTSGSQRSGDEDQARAQATYRIPSARWDDALAALRGIASKVLAEQTQTQDVSGQVMDLGARITNLQATEKALQAIMDRATKISDVLAVQQQLTDVRGQIEQLSTERSHLQAQAAFSTLTVSYSLKPPPAVTTVNKGFDPAAEVDRASASMVGILQALAAAGIWFVIVWLPILVALAILAGIAWTLVRRVRRSGRGPGSIQPVAQG